MLDLLNDYIFTIDKDKDISCAKMDRVCPAFDRGVEGIVMIRITMTTVTIDLFTVKKNIFRFSSLQ